MLQSILNIAASVGRFRREVFCFDTSRNLCEWGCAGHEVNGDRQPCPSFHSQQWHRTDRMQWEIEVASEQGAPKNKEENPPPKKEETKKPPREVDEVALKNMKKIVKKLLYGRGGRRGRGARGDAESVLYQYTSNSVECYNAVISKLTGGKRINFATSGSYQTRVKASVLQFNTSRAMSAACYAISKEPPTRAMVLEKRHVAKREKYAQRVREAKELDLPVRRSKYAAKAFRADKDYGLNAERPDIGDGI